MSGRVEGDTIETATLFDRGQAGLERRGSEVPRPERFARIGVDVHRLLQEAE